jgi:tetratricopeptide (TPR) repeat protein
MGSVYDGRFEIERRAGQGGMGAVYLARDRRTGKPVAVKVLHAAGAAEERARFSREARLLAELSHPAIVRYIAHGVSSEGEPYLVLEWLDGHDLATHLQRRGRLDVETSVAIARQLAEALRVAHARKILHRDLKPSNVFLRGGSPASVALLDFGLARGPGSFTLTRTGAFVGTVEYMAPEQARGGRELGPTVDIYALGCLLFECLVGRPPFAAKHVSALIDKVLFEAPPRLHDVLPGASPALDDLLPRLLAKRPEERLASAEALLDELDALGDLRAGPSIDTAGERAVRGGIARSEPALVGLALAESRAELDAEAASRLSASLAELGASFQRLSRDRGAAVVPSAGMDADEIAIRAVRSASSIMDAWVGARVGVVTGPASTSGPLLTGEAVEHAERLLASPGAALRIDSVSARLVDRRRAVAERSGPCVGREQELSLLETSFSACVDGSVARAILMVAEAGAGKTRLGHELLGQIEMRGEEATILHGAADPLDAGRAHALTGSLVRRFPLPSVPALAELLTELGDAPAGDDRLTEALAELLRRETARRPVLLLLDDLQWSDAASLRAVRNALDELHDRPILLLALARPEVVDLHPDLKKSRGLQLIRLPPLGKRACERLVQAALGEGATPEVVTRLVHASAGNPLFLEELMQVANGPAALTDTLRVILHARFARLAPATRYVLRAASIFGERAWRDGIAELLDAIAVDELDRSLEQLAEADIVQRAQGSRFPGEDEYVIRDIPLRDTAYSLLSDEDRRTGHRRAAEWLRRHGERDPERLAEHYRRGGDLVDAARHYGLAAELSAGVWSPAGGTWAERAEECRASGDDLGGLYSVRGWLAALHLDLPALRRFTQLAEASLRAGERPWCRNVMATMVLHQATGDHEALVRLVEAVLAVEPDAYARVEYVETCGRLAHGASVLGLRAAADRLVARCEHTAEALVGDARAALALAMAHGSRALFLRATSHRGVEEHRRRIAIARAIEHRGATAEASVFCSLALLGVGAYEEAVEHARNGLQEARALEHRWVALAGATALALAQSAMGASEDAWSEARVLAEEVIEMAPEALPWAGVSRAVLAVDALRRGDLVAGEAAARASTQALRATPAMRPLAHAGLVRVLLARGDTARALAAADEGLALATPFGRVIWDLDLRVASAEASLAAGDPTEIANVLWDIELRAAGIPDEDLRASFVARFPPCARARLLADALRRGS